jgi:hypothetical protein
VNRPVIREIPILGSAALVEMTVPFPRLMGDVAGGAGLVEHEGSAGGGGVWVLGTVLPVAVGGGILA